MRDPVAGIALRLAIVALVLAGVFGARRLLRRWQARRRAQILGGRAHPDMSQGEPTVVLFSGTLCSDCIRQKETLAAMNGSAGHFRVNEVMAAREPALAGRFGVQSVPATVILRGDGKAVAVNYGYVDGDVIASQLAKAG
ncbi:MAG: thioredoxin family protein [Candidatus Dormibacteraeota bacterium]|nr:thioredoxin family protein [Candidatus Dormibacteraeota bacterium]